MTKTPAEPTDDAAAKPNPRLQPLSVLVGTWSTVGTHPLVPGKTFHGRTSFGWIEGGAFLRMHSEIDEPEIPTAIALFGTDDASGSCSMLYFDERGVSRRYEVRLDGNEWRWWRDASDFSQRFVGSCSFTKPRRSTPTRSCPSFAASAHVSSRRDSST